MQAAINFVALKKEEEMVTPQWCLLWYSLFLQIFRLNRAEIKQFSNRFMVHFEI